MPIQRRGTTPGTHEVNVPTPTVAAGTAADLPVWRNNLGVNVVITRVGFTPDSDVTGDDTNNFSLTVLNKEDDGTGTTAVATKEYATGVDMSDFVEDELTLSTTAADLVVASGEVLALAKTEDNAGLELPEGLLRIEYEGAGV